jgi:hypothetical protein
VHALSLTIAAIFGPELALQTGNFCMNAVVCYLLSEFGYNHQHLSIRKRKSKDGARGSIWTESSDGKYAKLFVFNEETFTAKAVVNCWLSIYVSGCSMCPSRHLFCP